MSDYTHILDAVAIATAGVEPSMKAIARTLGVPSGRLYSIAKRPVLGEVYDPDSINWNEVNAFVIGKIDREDTKWQTMEDFVQSAVAMDADIAACKVTLSTTSRIEVDGELIPQRKTVMFEFGGEHESLICFKEDPAVYKMVYQTASMTVLRPVNEDGSFAAEKLRLVTNSTFNTKCVVPSQMNDAIAERFSGIYQPKADEADGVEEEDPNENADE